MEHRQPRRPDFSGLAGGGGVRRRVGHNYSELGSFDYISSTENLFNAWEKFHRGKRARPDVLHFEHNLEENIFYLQAELRSGQYRHGTYEPFTVWDPKQRKIHKASVRDRLVHQAAVSVIEPLFEPSFIYDSYSCRKGKGTHAGVNRLRTFLRQASQNDTRVIYALKCDIKQFFASVEHSKLLDLIAIQITDDKVMKLMGEIIGSFAITPGKGVPLGNLTSQLFANVYMHQFDFFVKHTFRERYYLRYCDDFVILSQNLEHLQSLLADIEEFLAKELSLILHPSKVTIRKWSEGIDFLGYVLKPHCTILRTKTKQRMMNRVNTDNLSSYLGLCSHANSYRLRQVILTKCAQSKSYGLD